MPAISFPTTPVIGVVSKDQDKLIHKNDFLNPTNLTPTNSSTFLKFYFKGIGSCFASLLVFSTLGISTVINFEIKTPTWIRLFNDVIMFPKRLFMIHGKLPYNGIYGPVYEEILFRYLLQEQLLKKIPIQILNKNAPQYVSAINTKTAKIARIAFSSAVYALAHMNSPYPANGVDSIVHKFALSLILGAIQESTGNLFYSTAFHMGNNALPAVILAIIPVVP